MTNSNPLNKIVYLKSYSNQVIALKILDVVMHFDTHLSKTNLQAFSESRTINEVTNMTIQSRVGT